MWLRQLTPDFPESVPCLNPMPLMDQPNRLDFLLLSVRLGAINYTSETIFESLTNVVSSWLPKGVFIKMNWGKKPQEVMTWQLDLLGKGWILVGIKLSKLLRMGTVMNKTPVEMKSSIFLFPCEFFLAPTDVYFWGDMYLADLLRLWPCLFSLDN